MRRAVRLIDMVLCRTGGLYEFSNEPGCILRIQLTQASHDVTIGNERISKGEAVLAIHLWNDRMPAIPKDGVNLEWALKFRRQVIYSFKELAKEIQGNNKFSRIRAVCGVSSLFSFSGHTGGIRTLQHLGFTVLPYHNPMGGFGEFWENLFSWWLMWAYNATSLDSRQFFKLERTEIWITVSEFLQRYGERT